MKTIGCPSGIGDFSWLWSKLCNVRDELDKILVADGWPYRTREYVELCGINCEYGQFNYQMILLSESVNRCETWDDVVSNPAETILLEPNTHLELGHRLEDWLPDLPTTFHYPLKTTEEDYAHVQKLLVDVPRPWIGVSCASYRGSEAWRTWSRHEWKELLTRLKAVGWNPVLLGGFWDDLTFNVARELSLPDLVGKTNTGECIALLDLLDSYIGFSSGLNVIRTVLNQPAFALWPDHQEKLATSWVPPHMLHTRRYNWSLYKDVGLIWPLVYDYLMVCDEGVKHYEKRIESKIDETEEKDTVQDVLRS